MERVLLNVSVTSFDLYPTELAFGVLVTPNGEIMGFPYISPIKGEWGIPATDQYVIQDELPLPAYIDTVYLSIVECQSYSLENILSLNKMESIWQQYKNGDSGHAFDQIIIGLAPYGGVAIWLYTPQKEILIDWMYAETIDIEMSDFSPENPNMSFDEMRNYYLNEYTVVRNNLERNGLPPRNLFDNYMKQFTYRYLQVFEKWDKDKERWLKYKEGEVVPEFDYIEEALFDGTHDKLHDGGLMKYHQAGKPKKLRVQWHIKKSEYTAYFWFEDERIREVFDKFYGAHPDTKTDFIIRIDAEKRKYELALYRYGLKEPQIIPEDVYQLLVFKNKFEDYRSENYNQERGAWIW